MRLFALLLLAVLIGLSSCTKEERKLMITKQEKEIDQFVETLVCDTVIYQRGVVRAVLEKGKPAHTADTVAKGDTIYFYYAGHIFSRGKGALFHTNSESVAKSHNRVLPEDQARVRSGVVGTGKFLKGLDYGFQGMASGEHAYLIFNGTLVLATQVQDRYRPCLLYCLRFGWCRL